MKDNSQRKRKTPVQHTMPQSLMAWHIVHSFSVDQGAKISIA